MDVGAGTVIVILTKSKYSRYCQHCYEQYITNHHHQSLVGDFRKRTLSTLAQVYMYIYIYIYTLLKIRIYMAQLLHFGTDSLGVNCLQQRLDPLCIIIYTHVIREYGSTLYVGVA